MDTKVSIIIINYNTLNITLECLDSIFKYANLYNAEIILVDNASTDGSKEFFSRKKNITYIYNDHNYGFGIANNIGAKLAKGKYLLFLNSDTILREDSISILAEYLDENSQTGAVGPLLVDKNGIDNGSYYAFKSHSLKKRFFSRKRHNKKVKKNNGFICGAALMMRREIFNKLGGFDPAFFMYHEEMDLQKRIYDIGFKCDTIDSTSIMHLKGASTKQSYKGYCMKQRSLNIYGWKHFKGWKYCEFRIGNILGNIMYLFSERASDFTFSQKLTSFFNELRGYGISNSRK